MENKVIKFEKRENKKDYMVRATAADAQIRAFAITSRNLVQTAHEAHQTAPVVTAALGRLMSGALMMGDMLKNDKDLLTIMIDSDGPIRGMTVTTDRLGNVKGYARVNRIKLPLKADGHLDVGGAVGKGTLTVVRDQGLKDPYSSSIPLHNGEIAEDLTWYFASSEQVPSSVGLGVLVGGDENVRQAGGFLIQLMPFASDEVIDHLEANLKQVHSITDMLKDGMTPEKMLLHVLDGFDVEIADTMPVRFRCNCDRDRVRRALILLGKEELDKMIADDKEVELRCQFCNKAYTFSVDELKDCRIKASSKPKREKP